MGRKILVIGVGFLGQKMLNVFKAHGFEVYGADTSNDENVKIDITSPESVLGVFDSLRPEVVVLTAGMTNVDGCEENPEACLKVNVQGTEHVVEACKKYNTKMVFISTDFVFDGEKGDYREEDDKNPLGVYARSKWEGEKIVRQLPGHVILRTSTLYGFNGRDDKMNFVKWAVSQLKSGQKVKIVSDQKTNPTLIDDLAEASARLVELDEEGAFHCVGSEALSRYDFVKKIIEVFGLDASLLEETDSQTFVQKAKRPADSSLNIGKLESKGISMHDCLSGLQEMKRQMEEGS